MDNELMAHRRKKFAVLILIVMIVFVFECHLTVAQNANGPQAEELWTRSQGSDWVTFLGPTGDGKSSETGILKDWSEGKLRIVWRAKTGDGYGMGSVANGRFYHFGRYGDQATLKCLNAETGKQLWEFAYESNYVDLFQYDGGPRASPVVDDGLVYVYGAEGMLYCLDAISGKERWNLNTGKRFGVIQNFFGVASTPVVYDDLLIVMVGGSPDESKDVAPRALDQVVPNGTGLIALDKKTGEFKYKTINDLASYCSLKLTTLNDRPTLLAWMRDSLYAVDPVDGEVRFEFPWRARILESVNASTPVIRDNQILISECYGKGSVLLSSKPDTQPAVIWKDENVRGKSLESHWNTPILVGDSLFGCSGRHSAQAELRCVDWATGKVRWRKRGLTRSSLTFIDGHFIVVGEQGQFLLIEATSEEYKVVTQYEPGEGDNRVKFRSPCWSAPIVSHGLLYVRGKDELVCFELIKP